MTPVREALERFAQAIEYGEPKTHMTAMGDRKSRTVTMSFPEEKCDMLIRQLRALSAAPGEPCAVKPLEWEIHATDGSSHSSETILGRYVTWESVSGYWMSPEDKAGRPVSDGLNAAKAAAQADYEKRIRSALVITPQPAAGWDEDYPYDDERFNKGVQHVVDLIARELGVTDWVAGDGSEDYDSDLWQTILNILAAKGLYDSEEAGFASFRREAPAPVEENIFSRMSDDGGTPSMPKNASEPVNLRTASEIETERLTRKASPDTAEARLREAAWFTDAQLAEEIHKATGCQSGSIRTANIIKWFRGKIAALSPPSGGDEATTYRVEYDGFVGNKIGSYVTREGKHGVVLQQIGSKVVHVYGQNRITPDGDEAKKSDWLCNCSWGCVEADNCRRREARKQAEEKPITPIPSEPSPPPDRREIVARECADELVQIVEAAERVAKRTGNTFVIDRAKVAAMIRGHLATLNGGK